MALLRSEAENYEMRPPGRPPMKETSQPEKQEKPSKRTVLATDKANEYISQAEAARIRGVSDQAIASLVRRNRLHTKTVAGRVVVLRSEVISFTPKAPGARPRHKASQKGQSHK